MKLKRFLVSFVTCLAASFGLKQVLEILIGFDIAFPCNALLNSIKDVFLIFLYLILDKTLTSKFMQNFCDDQKYLKAFMEDMKRETSNEIKNSSDYELRCTLSNLLSCRLENTFIFFFFWIKLLKLENFENLSEITNNPSHHLHMSFFQKEFCLLFSSAYF